MSDEPEAKRFKGAEKNLPEALVAVQKDAAAIFEALGLGSMFHVNDIGLHEQWLGCGLILDWTAHADYPTAALTVELVELIGRHQADGGDPEATHALESQQRAILAGLVNFESAVELYTESYLLCVKARKDIHKDEISKLTSPFKLASSLKVPKAEGTRLAAGPEQDLGLGVLVPRSPQHKPEEQPAEDIGATQVDAVDEDEVEEEDVNMSALSAMFGSG